MTKIYAERDLMTLDKAGNHYCRHVDHMTKEGLHGKSDIAAELGWRDMQIAELQRKFEALAVENDSLDTFIKLECWTVDDIDDSYVDACDTMPETPATDAAIAEFKAQGRAEGINFAAGRLAAAFNNGFIDKPMAEVFDVTRMILTAKEDIANNPAADGLSGEYAELALKQWEEQLCKESGK